jgi:hypothetical protein
MSVFMIKQSGIKNSQTEGEKSAKPIEDAVETAKPEPIQDSLPQKTAVKQEATEDEKPKKEDVLIKIDGPVSQIFTDALNRVLAVENYMAMMPLLLKAKEDKKADEVVEDATPILQVYAWDSNSLNLSDVVDITNEVTRHTDRTYVIAVEAAGLATKAMGYLDQLSSLKNVTICYSQSRAVEVVRARVTA